MPGRILPMRVAPAFENAFRKLYGKPCWGVKQGIGSFLTFEFGKPHLVIREPIVASPGASKKVREGLARRGANVHGDWHLWIYCCDWEVLFREKRVAHSESSDKLIACAAAFMNGQKLVRFSLAPHGVRCTFEFDLGGLVKTRPNSRTHEQWLLYEPKGKVLVLRADGRYAHHGSRRPESQAVWKPIRS
jgi:hypothetical protein